MISLSMRLISGRYISALFLALIFYWPVVTANAADRAAIAIRMSDVFHARLEVSSLDVLDGVTIKGNRGKLIRCRRGERVGRGRCVPIICQTNSYLNSKGVCEHKKETSHTDLRYKTKL